MAAPWLETTARNGRVPPAWTFRRKRNATFDVTLKNYVTGTHRVVRVSARSMADAASVAVRTFDTDRQCIAGTVQRALAR